MGPPRLILIGWKRAQPKFFILLTPSTNKSSPSSSLSSSPFVNNYLLVVFGIYRLVNRILHSDTLLGHTICSGLIDSAFLLSAFPLHVPERNTRTMFGTLLHVPFGRVEAVQHGLFGRSTISFNACITACLFPNILYQNLTTLYRMFVHILRKCPFLWRWVCLLELSDICMVIFLIPYSSQLARFSK